MNNPGTTAVVPRTRCSITWPQPVTVALVFAFTGWLVQHGERVRPALVSATTALAVVLLLTSVRVSGLRALAARVAGLRPDVDGPLPGML